MLWLQHLFALCLLAHMLWAAISLQREWQRTRRYDDPGRPGWREELVGGLTGADATQAGSR